MKSKLLAKLTFYFLGLTASWLLAFTSGCASGGYKLTRQYARWLNSQNIILRIVLYILTSVVFAVTLLIDAVVFNTMDFWNGTVAAGTYHFNQDEKTYLVQHEFLSGTQLRKSTIKISDLNNEKLQEVILQETNNHKIQMIVDGKPYAEVDSLEALPSISYFDKDGQVIQKSTLFEPARIALLTQ